VGGDPKWAVMNEEQDWLTGIVSPPGITSELSLTAKGCRCTQALAALSFMCFKHSKMLYKKGYLTRNAI